MLDSLAEKQITSVISLLKELPDSIFHSKHLPGYCLCYNLTNFEQSINPGQEISQNLGINRTVSFEFDNI